MMRFTAQHLIAAVLALLSCLYLWMAWQIPTFPIPRPVDSDVFPKLLGSLLLLLSIWLFVDAFTAKAAETAEENTEENTDSTQQQTRTWHWRSPAAQVLVTALAILAYALLLEKLGFVLSSSGLMFALACYYGYRAHVINLVTTLAIVLALYFVMTGLVGVHLPPGLLPF